MRTLLDTMAGVRGEHPFLIWEPAEGEGATWSYDGFVASVRRIAGGLVARGIVPGDRVLLHLDNRPEFLLAWFACAYAGAVAVTTNTRSAPDELRYSATVARVAAAITEDAFSATVGEALPPAAWMVVVGGSRGETPFSALDGDPALLPDRAPDPAAWFGIQFTSGTTARLKGVVWSHANALWGARESAAHEGLTPEDVQLVVLPLFHTNAQVYSKLASLWVGATVVLAPRFSASRFWPISLRHRCTFVSLVPFCVQALLARPVPERHSYRLFGNAVCEHPADRALGVRTLGWWGMTETVTHGIVGSPFGRDAPRSIGRPAPGYDVHVLDEGRRPVAPGETGDLYIGGRRGVSLFVEYLDQPEATAAAFEGGLFATGDRVRLDDTGAIFFIERAKDMLKVGGENVAASEIERVVLSVSGVGEVAVVGAPHAMLTEAPVAFVVPALPAPEGGELEWRIDAACAAALADFKRPVSIRLVADLPRSTLNKVAKAALRAELRGEQRPAPPSPAMT